MSRPILGALALSAMLAAVPGDTAAAPIFDEAADGDIDAVGDAFALAFGSNVIAGSILFSVDEGLTEVDDSVDVFDIAFDPAVLRLAEVLLTIEAVTVTNPSPSATIDTIVGALGVEETDDGLSAFSVLRFDGEDGIADAVGVPTAFSPLPPGSAFTSSIAFTGLTPAPGILAVDYSFDFVLAKVPEPATLAILGAGLLALAYGIRQRPDRDG